MRKYIIMALWLTTMSAQAQQISEEQAAQTAREFFEARGYGGTEVRGYEDTNSGNLAPSRPRTAAPSMLRLAHHAPDAYYIYNKVSREGKDGFVIVAADERMGDLILGWSDQGAFDYDHAPCGLKALLTTYQHAADMLSYSPNAIIVPAKEKNATAPRKANVVVEPMIKTRWNQTQPFNNMCPEASNGGMEGYNGRCPTGCVATAIAQVMNYWQWPKVGFHHHTNAYYETQTVDFTQSEYDWEHMPVTATDDPVETAAVGKLMYDVGCAADMIYEPSASAAYADRAVNAMINHFGYDTSLKIRGWFPYNLNGEKLSDILKEELDAGRPCIYTGGRELSHMMVIDGYDDEDYFHFNFGWGGLDDGYYRTVSITIYQFEAFHSLLVGIQPSYDRQIEKDNVYFSVSDNHAVVTGVANVPEGADFPLAIPSSVELAGKSLPVTDIWHYAFVKTLRAPSEKGITDLTIPGSIKDIPPYIFTGSNKLKELTLCEGVQRIGEGSFSNNSALVKLNMPTTIKTIGRYAFMGSVLKTIIGDMGNTLEEVEDSAFLNGHLDGCFLTFPATTRRIGKYAFGRTRLMGIEMKGKGYILDEEAFGGGLNLAIGLEGAAEIHRGAVSSSMTGTFTVQPTCIYHENAIGGHFSSIRLPAALKYFNPKSVQGTAAYSVDAANPCYSSADGLLYNKDRTELIAVPEGMRGSFDDKRIEVAVPPTVTKIAREAISPQVLYVTLPASVTQMDGALSRCTGLREVVCLNDVPPTVSDDTFWSGIHDYGNSVLKVPHGSKEAYEQAPVWSQFAKIEDNSICTDGPFYYHADSGYASVAGRNPAVPFDGHAKFPATVSIDGTDCPVVGLYNKGLSGDLGLQTITLGENMSYVYGEQLTGADNLYAILPAAGSDIKSIDGMTYHEQWGETTLDFCPPMQEQGGIVRPRTAVTIPSVIERIGQYALADNLRQVTIPATVTGIERNAFAACYGLNAIYCPCATPPYISYGDQAFPSSIHLTATLYVPTGSMAAYTSAYEWRDFTDIREYVPGATDVQQPAINDEESLAGSHRDGIYDLQGRRIAADGSRRLPKGIYIVGGRKVAVK